LSSRQNVQNRKKEEEESEWKERGENCEGQIDKKMRHTRECEKA
jgi:hypothetical protein